MLGAARATVAVRPRGVTNNLRQGQTPLLVHYGKERTKWCVSLEEPKEEKKERPVRNSGDPQA